MTTQDKPCGFCPIDGCGPERESCPLKPKKMAKAALNAAGVAVLVLSALAYDTAPMPLWAAATCLALSLPLIVRLWPPRWLP